VNSRDWCFMWLGVLLAVVSVVAIGKLNNARAESWLVVSGLALHLDGNKYCNELTQGLGLESVEGSKRYSVGFYRNSNCHWSAYAGRAWTPLRLGSVAFGVLGGGVTGYDHAITPVGALFAAVDSKPWGLNVTYIPPVAGSGNVLWLQAKRVF
jgi:hypothetical protein